MKHFFFFGKLLFPKWLINFQVQAYGTEQLILTLVLTPLPILKAHLKTRCGNAGQFHVKLCIIFEEFISFIKPQKCYFGPYQLSFIGQTAFVVTVYVTGQFCNDLWPYCLQTAVLEAARCIFVVSLPWDRLNLPQFTVHISSVAYKYSISWTTKP